jgi:hypothetical protein
MLDNITSTKFSELITKSILIIIVGNLNFFNALWFAKYIKLYIIPEYNKEKETKVMKIWYVFLTISIILISVYIIRSFTKYIIKNLIPSTINNVKPLELKEINGNIVLAFAFFIYLRKLIDQRIIDIYN